MKFIGKKIFLFVGALHLMSCNDPESQYLSGYSHADFIYLSHAASEKVEALLVSKGERVEKGQPLVKMEGYTSQNALRIAEKNYQAEKALLTNLESGERPDELSIIYAQLERARSAARLAKNHLERYQKLYATKVISAAELENAQEDLTQKKSHVDELSRQLKVKQLPSRQSQIDNQSARVESARLQWDKAVWDSEQSMIVAPVGARVHDIIYRQGERAAAGQPVISLLPPENIKIRIYIPEKRLATVQVGMKVRIWLDGREEPVSGHINYINPQAEYSPPVIYSTHRREKLIFMAEAVPDKAQAQYINIGQPARVEIVPNE
ncbi:HlyD family efflux transporter periplasmic adaptor subunit [Erwinia sp. 9145]|uniref:HlyD family secretion protein n=1 Tax=Erwinia sp. 9145 TaxID=1500895 RepID=UPI000AB3D017|nr:HlyD family efflux transporter periplasmic adaptor subunit [Erwinia sp. 9145]